MDSRHSVLLGPANHTFPGYLHLRQLRLVPSFPQSRQELTVSLAVGGVFHSGPDYGEPLRSTRILIPGFR